MINILELASELAHERLVAHWGDRQDPMIIGENYVDEAQDLFNDWYETYSDILNKFFDK